jgi:pimeloyl-ACP methyl ester carboxylesterase
MDSILILHGWGSKSSNWSTVKKLLEKGGFEVYVPDLPGFGDNPVPDKPWSVSDYAEWVEDFCRRNGLARFSLIGHSFGGGVALRFAADHGEMVQGLVLVNPAVVRVKNSKCYLGLAAAKTGNLILSVPLLSRLKPFLRKVLYRFLGTRDYRRLDFDKTNVMKETFKKVVSEDLSRYLPAVQVRTLVVWGEKDKLTPLSQGYSVNGRLPYSRMEIIKGGKHAINLEAPDVLAEKILNFIKS